LYFQTPCVDRTLWLSSTLHCTQYIHLNTFQTSARPTETFHVLPFIATNCFPFPLNCFHSTFYVCTFPGCEKIIPCNFNSTCLCSNTQLWPGLGVCNGKNGSSEDICDFGRHIKVSVERCTIHRVIMSWEHNW
jgi:hypothetical protein